MKKIAHHLKFVTEFDETNPIAQRFLALDELEQVTILEGLLYDEIAPRIQPILDELNERGTYAILKNESDFIDLVYDFADMFAEDNPNFQEKKFVQACGLDIL